MKMKSLYEDPELEIIRFDSSDIICGSLEGGPGGDIYDDPDDEFGDEP